MKRIARMATAGRDILPVLDGYPELIQLLRRYLSPSTARLFARPEVSVWDTGMVEWYSDLGGHPQHLGELEVGEAARIRTRLQGHLDSIRELADQLERLGELDADAIALLRQAAQTPDPQTVMVLGEVPVITFWGGPQPVVEPAPVEVPVQPLVRRRWRMRWVFWLLLALLLILGGLLWWLPPQQSDPLRWWQRVEARLGLCEVVEVESAPGELVLLLDSSGSMAKPLAVEAPPLWPEWLQPLQGFLQAQGWLDQESSPMQARMAQTRQATAAMIAELPETVGISVVLVSGDFASRAGRFEAAQRPALRAMLEGLQPEGGTPLADALSKGALLARGRDGARLLVIADGPDSRRQDPCAVMAQIHREQPGLQVDVVDILGHGAGQCLAELSGGRVFTARGGDELAAMIRQATAVLQPAVRCRD